MPIIRNIKDDAWYGTYMSMCIFILFYYLSTASSSIQERVIM